MALKLREGTNTKNNQPIYFLDGKEAYPIYNSLPETITRASNWYKKVVEA